MGIRSVLKLNHDQKAGSIDKRYPKLITKPRKCF